MSAGNLKLLIADDEAPARARLRDMLLELGGWSLVGEATNGSETLTLCQELQPDVVLLDIRMPEMDGIEVASHLSRMPVSPAVVFTTAYDEYAVKAFETNAVGYLLKPVRRERLFKALEQAARLSRMQMATMSQDNPGLGGRKNIPVSVAGALQLVPVQQIISFHADQKYVRMVYDSADGLRDSLIDESLKALEMEFAPEFCRIHRNSLVRVSSIDVLGRDDAGQYLATMRVSEDKLPVSRRHLAALKQQLA